MTAFEMQSDGQPGASSQHSMTTHSMTESGADFYSGVYVRLHWFMIAVALIAAPLLFLYFGLAVGIGFLLGTGVAFLNLHWLKRLVFRLGEMVLQSSRPPRGGRMAAMFLLRYALISLGVYVIFKSSISALYGFFAGLALPVAGIFCEAGYEFFAWLRHKS